MTKNDAAAQSQAVALLAEGVDRNQYGWFERRLQYVALLAEGVDRNIVNVDKVARFRGRPPRGGRG